MRINNTPTEAQVHEATDIYREDGFTFSSLEEFVAIQYPRHSVEFQANMTAAIRAAL